MPQTLLDRWTQTPSLTQHDDTALADGPSSVNSTNTAPIPMTSPTILVLAPKGLHQNVTFRRPEKDDVHKLKRINSLLLPIPYPESFYKEIVSDSEAQALTLLAFWKDNAMIEGKGTLVGAMRCRLSSNTPGSMLYISTLVLLSPYRGLGIATCMLKHMIRQGVEEHAANMIGAHVWEANEVGLKWYEKQGFKESNFDAGYYRKLEPHGARIMSRSIGVFDLIDKI